MSLLDPYEPDDEGRLIYFAGIVDWQTEDHRAQITVRVLGLNRLDLVTRRCERILKVRDLVEAWRVATGPVKVALSIGIRQDAEDGEFPSAVMSYLDSVGFR